MAKFFECVCFITDAGAGVGYRRTFRNLSSDELSLKFIIKRQKSYEKFAMNFLFSLFLMKFYAQRGLQYL